MYIPHTVCTVISLVVLTLVQADAIQIGPRIIGGVAIRNRCRAPYNSMVALQFSADFSPITFCSAVMVTDTFLVTTAKCLFTMAEMRNVRVAVAVVGERDTIMQGEPGEQRIAIKSFRINSLYNATTRAHNIGMIELARAATLGRCVKPAQRTQKDPKACEDVDETCQITGWGSYVESQNPTNSRLPRAAKVVVYSEMMTTLLSAASTEVPPYGSIYAETVNPFQKACFFDWGGVVSCQRNNNNILRGVISDHNCNSQQAFPILVLDIEYYWLWIDRCVQEWSTCPSLK